jgi:hypothetical protein
MPPPLLQGKIDALACSAAPQPVVYLALFTHPPNPLPTGAPHLPWLLSGTRSAQATGRLSSGLSSVCGLSLMAVGAAVVLAEAVRGRLADV